jgi:hypothetical protein
MFDLEVGTVIRGPQGEVSELEAPEVRPPSEVIADVVESAGLARATGVDYVTGPDATSPD